MSWWCENRSDCLSSRRRSTILACFVWRHAAAAALSQRVDGADSFAPRKALSAVAAEHPHPPALPALDGGKLDHLIILPEHRLLFCYIDQVHARGLNEVFRALRSPFAPEQAKGAINYNYTQEALRELFVNTSWHKAVFLRDPIERFVDAFRGECGATGRCTGLFGASPMTLAEAVEHLKEQVDGGEPEDGQLMEQRKFCGGLDSTIKYYDTVVQVNDSTTRGEVEKLLATVNGTLSTGPLQESLDTWFPENGTETTRPDARDYFRKDKPWILRALLRHYRRDYIGFGMPLPEWAADYLREGGLHVPQWKGPHRKARPNEEESDQSVRSNGRSSNSSGDSSSNGVHRRAKRVGSMTKREVRGLKRGLNKDLPVVDGSSLLMDAWGLDTLPEDAEDSWEWWSL